MSAVMSHSVTDYTSAELRSIDQDLAEIAGETLAVEGEMAALDDNVRRRLGFMRFAIGELRIDRAALQGEQRHFHWAYDPAPHIAGRQGAGTVHHIAFSSRDDEQLAWRERIVEADGYVSDVRDRDYFRSIYFREPRGVLFEIATLSPGFAIDEDPEHLGEALGLPAQHEHLREQLERALSPVVNPRAAAVA